MKSLPQLAASLLCLAIFTAAVSRAQDIRGYEVDRYEYFSQCTTNPAPLNTARAHALVAFVIGSYDGAVSSATLARGSSSWPLTNNGSHVEAHVTLSKAASAGAYVFTVTTASQGVQRKIVSLPGLANKVGPPRIANFTEAQSIDATQPFTLEWDAIKGTGTRDYLKLHIYNSANELLVDDRLARDETSFTIPAGTLAAGTTNTAYLRIVHVVSLHPPRNGQPYTVGVEIRLTRFNLKTLHPEGQLSFGSHQLFAYETNGVINIPVNRSGSEGEVTVDYFTENITAQAGVNYVARNGTLTFPDGVTNQSISVPLLDDGEASGPLIARVRLTNATGGLLLPARPWLDWSILDAQTDPGQNINAVVLSKVSFFFQTNDDLGDQSTRCITSRFFVSVHPKFPGGVRDALLHLPRKGTRAVDTDYLDFLEHNENFPTRALADKKFPAGPYAVDFNTLSQGHMSESLRMVAEPRFPIPHLTNWTEAQTIDSTAPFTLQWESFTGVTSNDFVLVGIRDDAGVYVLQTPESFEAGVLSGTATSYEIPPNTLNPGERYLAELVFGKTARYNVDASSSVQNCIVFDHTVGFHIHTQTNTAAFARSPRVRVTSASDCCGANVQLVEEPLSELFSSQKFNRSK